MSEHAITVMPTSDGRDGEPRWRAYCACGMAGIRTGDRRIAEGQATQHLDYVADVKQLHGERP